MYTHKVDFLFFVTIFVFFIVPRYNAQDLDSIKTYKFDEIIVKSGIILEPKTVTEIDNITIKKSDAGSVIQLTKFIPSVKAQTNSRGESLFYLRGSGERQLTLLFDGVPMNIPWDNRIDLSLIPTDAIEAITVTKGIPSVIYGANTLAGVIDISSVNISGAQNVSKLNTKFGENNSQRYSGYWLGGISKYSYLISLSYKKSDGYTLPESYDNPIANPSSVRVNSQNRGFSSFGKLKYNISNNSDIGLSFSYITSEKGVPPETDVENPRYWQYPKWKKLSVSIGGSHRFENGNKSIIAYSFAGSKFNMQIDQFTDNSYSLIDDIEKDDDLFFNGRVIYTRLFGASSLLKFSLNGTTTIHEERLSSTNFEKETFSQNIFSAGVEYEYFTNNYSAILGASLDGTNSPKTGDKLSKDAITDYSITGAFVFKLSPQLSTQINIGRKTRFPTLRESFSGALGRFVPNPSLKAEVAYSGEAGIGYLDGNYKADLNLFLTLLNDGIVRKSLPEKQFQRVNEDKIRTYGIEFYGTSQLYYNLLASLNFTYLNSFAKNSSGNFRDTLEYKPQFITGLNFDYSFLTNFNSILEINYVGKEFGLKEGSEYFQKLPDYILFNFRIAYSFELFKNANLQIFGRVNNIFDKLYFTQWSLPEAGRQFYGGISAEF